MQLIRREGSGIQCCVFARWTWRIARRYRWKVSPRKGTGLPRHIGRGSRLRIPGVGSLKWHELVPCGSNNNGSSFMVLRIPETNSYSYGFLSFGDETFAYNTNHEIINFTVEFILETNRFSGPLFWFYWLIAPPFFVFFLFSFFRFLFSFFQIFLIF